jgi:hypothetical protein
MGEKDKEISIGGQMKQVYVHVQTIEKKNLGTLHAKYPCNKFLALRF